MFLKATEETFPDGTQLQPHAVQALWVTFGFIRRESHSPCVVSHRALRLSVIRPSLSFDAGPTTGLKVSLRGYGGERSLKLLPNN